MQRKAIIVCSVIALLVLLFCIFFASCCSLTAPNDKSLYHVPVMRCLPGARLQLTDADDAKYRLATVSDGDFQYHAVAESYKHTKIFLVRDQANAQWHIYQCGYFIGAQLSVNADFALWAPLLDENNVRLSSNHVRDGTSRYTQWDTPLIETCEIPATQYNYRLLASIFDTPVAWIYQTNTDANGTPLNNKIMDARSAPSLTIYRTWYVWTTTTAASAKQ